MRLEQIPDESSYSLACGSGLNDLAADIQDKPWK
jgi:hypothetical protein